MFSKKNLLAVLLCIVMTALLAGCGGGGEQKTPAPADNEKKVGAIKHLNESEEDFGKSLGDNHKATFYDSMNAMQMALDAGQIDAISTYKNVADYLVARNDKFEIVPDSTSKFSDYFCFAVRGSDIELHRELDVALDAMTKDGTLEKLTKEYITDLKKDQDPPAVEIQHIDGADTLKIAVTGDLPPMDLVLANGQVAGFNTAMLAEMAKRLNKNVEIIQVESAARASALTSDKADVIFWAIQPADNTRPQTIDTPEGVVLTKPYFKDDVVEVGLKK